MKHTLNETADAFVDVLNEWGAKHLAPEYAQKQQVSKEVPPARNANQTSTRDTAMMPSGRTASEGIHLVPEPPAIPEETEWSDSDTAREQFNNITGRS